MRVKNNAETFYEIQSQADGGKHLTFHFEFFLDDKGATMFDNMINELKKLPHGEEFDNSYILNKLIEAGTYDEEVFENNLFDLLDGFQLYCEFFNKDCDSSQRIGIDPFFIRVKDDGQ